MTPWKKNLSDPEYVDGFARGKRVAEMDRAYLVALGDGSVSQDRKTGLPVFPSGSLVSEDTFQRVSGWNDAIVEYNRSTGTWGNPYVEHFELLNKDLLEPAGQANSSARLNSPIEAFGFQIEFITTAVTEEMSRESDFGWRAFDKPLRVGRQVLCMSLNGHTFRLHSGNPRHAVFGLRPGPIDSLILVQFAFNNANISEQVAIDLIRRRVAGPPGLT
ncbi:MAG: hypothetical protein JNM27_13690 [Leptospirales bacterium]|nr:hypothetical protein [Leptospirales bacterium]